MKRHQFTTIEEVKQAHQLIRSGVLVAERTEGFFHILLYQLESGYMEVYRHRHFNVIIKANHFTDLAYLDPWLENISLPDFI